MKKFLPFLCLLFSIFGQAQTQQDSLAVIEAIAKLEEALIQKDTQKLEQILHPKLSLGHSNAWIEDKMSLLENLPTNAVFYKKFCSLGSLQMQWITSKVVWVRREIIAKGTYKIFDFEMKLNLLEIWIKNENNWQLVARQSVEIKPE
ncbi:nuclear transport factor 2 family protein [Vaginella massiliensis]|uniref:nuclear transport factor 2 family protein n=1 Tax=Vaginella massiliensis TaxID=1816680 RepID=UPI000837CE4F|nr:nuclear transport factor 2 family protein [Vaginella massiliensis]